MSEGKTTDEVAVILGVSGNTVNSYITHAIQKLSASNRPMAIADGDQERHHLTAAAAAARRTSRAIAFGERRTLFGDFALGRETHRTVTIPDAVRRCRWIAVDLNAQDFALFFVGPSAERPRLAPCFDSNYPGVAEITKRVAGGDRSGIIRHARASSVPCWWSDTARFGLVRLVRGARLGHADRAAAPPARPASPSRSMRIAANAA